MPVGSPVSAARGGVVTDVVTNHDGHGWHAPNNLIEISHGDGTFARYLHLQKDGGLVAVGDRVVQGQIIARSGHVGRSLAPHLHFEITNPLHLTIPTSFAEVSWQKGVPRIFFLYTSRNATR